MTRRRRYCLYFFFLDGASLCFAAVVRRGSHNEASIAVHLEVAFADWQWYMTIQCARVQGMLWSTTFWPASVWATYSLQWRTTRVWTSSSIRPCLT